jgi:hypothetical protein
MRSRYLAAAALALPLIGLSGAAAARDIPAGGLTIGEVVTWLQGEGYKAQIITGDDGKQHVSSESSGIKFGVYVFDCKADRCGSFQFSAGFATHGKFDTSQMNKWNRDKRWCRGYFDSVNDPWVEEDVDLSPGGTYEMMDDEFTVFKNCMDGFTTMYSLK